MNPMQQLAGSRTARYQPALLGGLFIGVISSLPVVGEFNVCCCLWVVTGGLLTTYLLQQNTPEPLETSFAAMGGLIAGGLGGAITSLLSPLVLMMMGVDPAEGVDQMLGQMGDVPPEMAAWAERAAQLSTGPLGVLVGALVRIPMYGVFGLLGALLGLAFFRKKAGPAAA